MSTGIQLMTAQELLWLPKNGQLYELVRGELRTMTPAGFGHGAIEYKLGWPMGQFVDDHDLGIVVGGDTGFQIASNPDTVRAADVAFVAKQRITNLAALEGYFPGAPDAAAEVISPNDRMSDVDAKVQEWLDAGTRLVWVVNPRRREVTVYAPGTRPIVLTEADTLDGQDVIPGFRIAVKALFPAKK